MQKKQLSTSYSQVFYRTGEWVGNYIPKSPAQSPSSFPNELEHQLNLWEEMSEYYEEQETPAYEENILEFPTKEIEDDFEIESELEDDTSININQIHCIEINKLKPSNTIVHKEIKKQEALPTIPIVQESITQPCKETPQSKETPSEIEVPNTDSVKKPKKRPFLKRKEVYDPRKAIESEKKKKEEQEERERQNKILIDNKSESEVRQPSVEELQFLDKRGGSQAHISIEENEDGKQEDEAQRSPKYFLKRKTKRVVAQKLDWKKVERRIDCWKKPSPESKKIEKKMSKPPETIQPTKNFVPLEEIKQTQSQTQTPNKELRKIPYKTQESTSVSHKKIIKRLSLEKLQLIYAQCHGTHSTLDSYFPDSDSSSKIPVLSSRSNFVGKIDSKNSNTFYEQLSHEFSQLSQ